MVRIGINGFGRIGKLVLRASIERGVDVVAINAPNTDVKYIVYMIKFDSTHGRFTGDVSEQDGKLFVNGNEVVLFGERDPARIKWSQANVDIVVEASGCFTTIAKAEQHLQANNGVTHVLITAPSEDAPTLVMGVNHESYDPSMTMVSNASCTTNCLAPILMVINDAFGIEEALFTAVQSATATQAVVDGVSAKGGKRIGRSASINIVPTTTGASKAISKVIPEMAGKVTGMTLRVPTANVSAVDLTARLKTATSYESIKKVMKEASKSERWSEILGYTEDEVVSQDFNSGPRSAIFDAKASIMIGERFVKMIAWYDNEYGYSCRVVDLIKYMATRDTRLE